MAYTQALDPFIVPVMVGVVSASAQRSGATMVPSFTGEIRRAEFTDDTAITGDNTNYYGVYLCRNTFAAPRVCGVLRFVTSTNLTAGDTQAFTIDGVPTGITTTLGAAITSTTATSITTASGASPFPVAPSTIQWYIKVDNEVMLVTAGANSTTLTVQRGVNGTTAATHANGATVSMWLDKYSRRVGGSERISVEMQKNGTGANTVNAQVFVTIVPVYDHSNE